MTEEEGIIEERVEKERWRIIDVYVKRKST